MTENFREILEKFPDRKVNSRKFNEIFQVDGIPLWFFLEPLIKAPHIPRPFRSLDEIENRAREGKCQSWANDLKLSVLKKGLIFNEKFKAWFSSAREKRSGGAGAADILFLAYTNQIFKSDGGPDFLGFGGVINDLKKLGVKPLVIVCDPVSRNSLFGLRKFDNVLYSFVEPEIIKKSSAIAKKLAGEWKKVDKKSLFAHHGRDYWKFLGSEMNFLFSREMLETMIMYYLTFKKIIEEHDVKLVYLTGIIGVYESALFGAVSKMNKKIVYSPHGYGGYAVPLYLRETFYKNFIFAASGSEEKKRLMNLGIKKEHIFITGSPFFDKIVEYKSKKDKPKTGKVITLITQPLVEDKYVDKGEYFNYIRRFLVQIAKVKNIAQIIIKLHPREKYRSCYESIVKTLGLKNASVTQELGKDALYSILSKSDLVVSTGSTTDIEGIMLDKNVIVIDGLAKGFLAELSKKDKYREAVYEINKNDDLTDAVTKILTSRDLQERLRQERRRYLAGSFYKIDGKAHERVSALILRLIKREKE